MTRPRVVFFGTPAFALPCLRAAAEVGDVVRVVTQPDRPAGRGLALKAPPIKELALSLGLAVTQPTKVRTADFAASLRALEADVAVVVAYGRILPRAVLDAPRRGCVNVHASLLPRWRGAAPIQWAIVHGDPETGVSLMQMDEGMDTGPVLAERRVPIDPDEDAATLAGRLSVLGGELLRAELPRHLASELAARAQDERLATLAPLLRKEDGLLDFELDARRVHDRVRGMNPWPGAYTTVGGERVRIHRTRLVSEEPPGHAPGTMLGLADRRLDVACGRGMVCVEELQLEGKRRMAAADALSGRLFRQGARFGT